MPFISSEGVLLAFSSPPQIKEESVNTAVILIATIAIGILLDIFLSQGGADIIESGPKIVRIGLV